VAAASGRNVRDLESDDPERWIWVECEGSHDGYRDMEMFIGTVSEPDRADRLEIAIQGRGAFGRFKDVLARWPGELERWFAFSEDRQRGGPGPGWPAPATGRRYPRSRRRHPDAWQWIGNELGRHCQTR